MHKRPLPCLKVEKKDSFYEKSSILGANPDDIIKKTNDPMN